MEEPQPRTSLVSGGREEIRSTRKSRKSRGRGLRANTGCIVCRKRHIKCDEAKPACGPCTKARRECTYDKLDAATSSHDKSSVAQDESSLPELPRTQAAASSPRQSTDQHIAPARSGTRSPLIEQWPSVAIACEAHSPYSAYSNSTAYGVEFAPLRWYSLLADDAATETLNSHNLEVLIDAEAAFRQFDSVSASLGRADDGGPVYQAVNAATPRIPEIANVNPVSFAQADLSIGGSERRFWQSAHPIQLEDHEVDIFERFVKGVSLWLDLFDPKQHFSTYVPHLAMHNEGLIRAVLALGARHLSIKPMDGGEASMYRTASVQYYYDTLKYLQSAMQYLTYKSSLEFLATVMVVSTYEMIDGAGKGWERHLKGVFWIQRSLNTNGECGGLEQAIWWSWIRQDVWAAFRERRRCFSFFKPTRTLDSMDVMEMASRVIYLLAQSVNYSSEEETQAGQQNLSGRIAQADTLLEVLQDWKSHTSVHFEPLPVESRASLPFRPLWIHPPAVGAAIQMYSMSRILLLVFQPSAGGYTELAGRQRLIADEIDTIAGIALKCNEDGARVMSTQCLFAAGLYCTDSAKRTCITDLIEDHCRQTGWPPSHTYLSQELRQEWAKPTEIR